MDKLTALLKKYASWVRLGQINLDKFVEANVDLPESYIINFKSLRVKRKDIERWVKT